MIAVILRKAARKDRHESRLCGEISAAFGVFLLIIVA